MRPGKLVAVFALFARVYVNAACVPRPAVSAAEFVHLPFDFLVIGGGTAGVALSSRLAEDPRLVVGLIEAGDIHLNDPIVDVPSNSPVGNATYDWRFSTIPQVNLGGKIVPVPRRVLSGKMLGGSSGINGLAWGRASSVEYDAWSSFASDSSWSWAGLLPFMKKSESFYFPPNNPFPGISKQQAAHALKDLPRVDGFSGPIAASHNTQYFDPVFKMTDTLNEQGIPTNAEPQAGNAIGVINTLRSLNLTEGVRSYAAPTYYCSHANDTNYHVIATKVHFASHASPFIATGVEFVVGNKAYVATARREVILSAGTVQTPQLLELSGIGNSSVLAQHGIPTLVNLPGVGENLQEHTFATVQWKLQPGVTTFDILRNNATNKTRGGLLAATDAMVAFLTLGDIASPEELDAFLNIFDQEANVASGAPFTRLQNKFRRDWFAKGSAAAVELIHLTRGIINPEANQSYVTVLAGILHPSSKGSIHISSSDALSAPTIDLNLLSSAFDRAVIVQFMKFVQKIGKATPFSDIVNLQTDPDASIQTDEELSSYIDATSSASLDNSDETCDLTRYAGTAAIGPRDEGGVVDNSLKVYGTANLRVVDASVIPLHIAAHTQATIYAIAEKAADAILKCI
ncbi:alcohol oxidase [Trametes meyenii]|nr:alcohol oxidase [Trametes meyenii]